MGKFVRNNYEKRTTTIWNYGEKVLFEQSIETRHAYNKIGRNTNYKNKQHAKMCKPYKEAKEEQQITKLWAFQMHVMLPRYNLNHSMMNQSTRKPNLNEND